MPLLDVRNLTKDFGGLRANGRDCCNQNTYNQECDRQKP